MSVARVLLLAAAGAVAAGAFGLLSVVAVVAGLGDSPAGGTTAGSPGAPLPVIPPAMLSLYQQGATSCDGLSWTVLAAIGTVESDNGTSDAPGVQSGANPAGAEGPMQFEPGTFDEYALPVPPGGASPPSPYDPTDAVYAAARLLCANGAAGGADLEAAVLAYNHSTAYVIEVLELAGILAAAASSTP